MRAILFSMFLLSTFIYSQNLNSKDMLFTKSGGKYNCFVSEVNSNYIVTKSDGSYETKFMLNTIEQININGLGNIYSSENGFETSADSVNIFLNERNFNIAQLTVKDVSPLNEEDYFFNKDKKYFFSVHYFPTQTNQIVYSHYPRYDYIFLELYPQQITYTLEQTLVAMESQIGIHLNKNSFVTIALGYSSDLYKATTKSTESYLNNETLNLSSEAQNSMDKLLLEIGIKFYFGQSMVDNVNPFLALSAGKQFAFTDNYSKTNNSEPTTDYAFTDNAEEFLEGLNSPFFASASFGAEYFIAKSLSLSGILKIKYNYTSSKYQSAMENIAEKTEKYEEEVEETYIRYKTGLGLTFFF